MMITHTEVLLTGKALIFICGNNLTEIPLTIVWTELSLKRYKVKCTPAQALSFCTGSMAHRGSRGIALPFLDHGTRRGWGSVSRPSRSLPPGKTRYPLYRRLGGPQGQSR